jgi:hypothetical protein
MTRVYGGGMADHEDWTPGDVASMVANPFYAINIDEGLALPHEPLISEDDWVKTNVGLIEERTRPGSLPAQPAVDPQRQLPSQLTAQLNSP